jgi:DNA ligase (NAD+)
VLYALGIRHIGEEMAERLARNFNSIEPLEKATYEELTAVPTIGPKIAESILDFFKVERNLEMVRKLKDAGVNLKDERPASSAELPLSGVEFVITGKLVSFRRS